MTSLGIFTGIFMYFIAAYRFLSGIFVLGLRLEFFSLFVFICGTVFFLFISNPLVCFALTLISVVVRLFLGFILGSTHT